MTHQNQASFSVAADAKHLAEAGRRLRAGGLVAFPTETVYGLGADATSDQAVAAIYTAKGRPSHNPLITHILSIDDARKLAVLDARSEALMESFWPAALTLVLPRRADSPLAGAVSAGTETVALRCPAHPVARQLLAEAGIPIAAPSANASGKISPTTAAHVLASLPQAGIMVLDGGACPEGIESTVVDLSTPVARLLRPGSITPDQLRRWLPELEIWQGAEPSQPQAPGMLESHYAPSRPVRLNALDARPDEAFIAFGDVPTHKAGMVINLSPTADLEEAASRLYAALHAADQLPFTGIAIMPIPCEGVGVALNDRLRRAAWRGIDG